MATPNLDIFILAARRYLKDTRNRNTGAEIVDASEDGRKYKVQVIVDMIEQATNQIQNEYWKSLGAITGIEKRGSALGHIFPEYRKNSGALTPTLGTPGMGLLYTTMPDDLGFIESVSYLPGNAGVKRARIVDPLYVEGARENTNKETARSTYSYIQGDKIFVYVGSSANLTEDKISIHYVARQKAMTQNGSVDIVLNSRHVNTVLKLIFLIAQGQEVQ